MKLQLKKVAAVTLAMTMCLPCVAFAEEEIGRATLDAASQSGKIDTSFGVYAPPITVNVPVKANIRINPLAEDNASGADSNTVKNFTVASNSIDVRNSSMDDGTGIPVNVTVSASISKAAKGVMQVYSDFTPVEGSTQKKIHLDLAEAKTAASADGTTEAVYDMTSSNANLNKAVVTKYGSLLSVDIDAPADADNPEVGSFAVVGGANANADWRADDIAVNITYRIKASKPLAVKTPTVADLTVVGGSDLEITVNGIGEAKVTALGAHNDEAGKYGDYLWEAKAFTVDYSTSDQATITIKGTDAGLGVLAKDGYKGIAQDFIIGLSDGRMVVTTLTVN